MGGGDTCSSCRGSGELKTAVSSAGVSSAANLLAFVTLRSSPACLCATHTHTQHLRRALSLSLHQLYVNFPNARFFLPVFHKQLQQQQQKESCKTLT